FLRRGVVDRRSPRLVRHNRSKHESIAAGRQFLDFEVAVLYGTAEKSGRLGFRSEVLSRDHARRRLAVLANNLSTDDAVPKDFEIRRTRNSRTRANVFGVPPESPPPGRGRNTHLITRLGQIVECI